MKVTFVHLRIFPPDRKRVKAVGSMVIDGEFQVEHIHVIQHDDGDLRVGMPARYENDSWHDYAHPITKRFREEVNKAVIGEYNRLTKS
jgi:stage V sporulation protein G